MYIRVHRLDYDIHIYVSTRTFLQEHFILNWTSTNVVLVLGKWLVRPENQRVNARSTRKRPPEVFFLVTGGPVASVKGDVCKS